MYRKNVPIPVAGQHILAIIHLATVLVVPLDGVKVPWLLKGTNWI